MNATLKLTVGQHQLDRIKQFASKMSWTASQLDRYIAWTTNGKQKSLADIRTSAQAEYMILAIENWYEASRVEHFTRSRGVAEKKEERTMKRKPNEKCEVRSEKAKQRQSASEKRSARKVMYSFNLIKETICTQVQGMSSTSYRDLMGVLTAYVVIRRQDALEDCAMKGIKG